jgi:hypothetical protein
MPGVVPRRPAAVGPAQDDPVTAASWLSRAGRAALARLPGHDDPAWPPRVPVAALLRIWPPVRPGYLFHAMIRTYERTKGKVCLVRLAR